MTKPMDGDDFCLNTRTHELEVGFEVISMDTQKFKKDEELPKNQE